MTSVSDKKSENLDKQNAKEKVVYIDAQRIPVLDEYSLSYLSKIVKNDMRYLEFDENLVIYSLSDREIGKFSINVNSIIKRQKNCFKIVAKSSGVLDDIPCGTEIVAVVNEKLETLEQDHFEYISFPNGRLEKRTTITLNDEDDEYIISKTENNQNVIKKIKLKVKKPLMKGFISESSNILLQRLMIQNNLIDDVNYFTLDSDLNPCGVNYRALDTRFITLSSEEIELHGIERTVESIADMPTTWQIYFNSDGHMINRVQIGYPAVMKVLEKPNRIEIDEYLPKIQTEKKPLNWEDDVQLKSNYLDRKEELKNEYDQYLKDNPELKELMSDYMQSILAVKPDDIFSYTAKYFASYSSKTSSNKLLPTYTRQINIPKH